MSDLFFHASYSFVIDLSNCKVGKEGIHQLLMEIIRRDGFFLHRWNNWTIISEKIVCSHVGEPFGNLRFKEEVIITDNSLCFRYVEQTDQQVMLPNIQSFVCMMLYAVKAAEQVQNGFDVHAVKCTVELENNAEVYFYEKYSPLTVDFSRLLKYGIPHEKRFEIEVESHGDVYALFNRFYQQYYTSSSIVKPYVTLIKEQFDKTYAAI